MTSAACVGLHSSPLPSQRNHARVAMEVGCAIGQGMANHMCDSVGVDAGRSARSTMHANESAVFEAELRSVRARRHKLGAAGELNYDPCNDVRELPDTLGVACSGGGVRSGAFCSGALGALASRGILPRVDYLSAVSGGGYAATALITYLQHHVDNEAARSPGDASSRAEDQFVGVAKPWAASAYCTAAQLLQVQMKANSSYLVRRGVKGGRPTNCLATALDILQLVWAMARMLIGVPLVAASASLLVAEAANAATGESLRTLIASAAFGEVYHLFMWQFWASVAVVAVATAVLRGATGCSRSSLVTAQVRCCDRAFVVGATTMTRYCAHHAGQLLHRQHGCGGSGVRVDNHGLHGVGREAGQHRLR